jgi:hypothetical protein
VQVESLGQLKNPMASPRIETASFRLVAECLNQLRYRVPPNTDYQLKNKNLVTNFYQIQQQMELVLPKF